MLEYVPGAFRVTRHVRPKLSCRGCEAIAQAPAPSLPIYRGLAGPGLLTHVLVAKYCDHLPLYRQAGIYARDGIDLDRSTLADWVGQTARLMRPLVAAVGTHVMTAARVHADDTTVPVLDSGRGKIKPAYVLSSAGERAMQDKKMDGVLRDIRVPSQRAERPMADSAEKLSMFHYHTEQQCWATVTTRR